MPNLPTNPPPNNLFLFIALFSIIIPSILSSHFCPNTSKSKMNQSSILNLTEQQNLIHKLQLFTIQGRDKHGLILLRIIAQFFPARLLSAGACIKYLEEKVFPNLADKPFSVVYVHTGVDRRENFPGISPLRSFYDAIPIKVRDNLQTIYFLHPGFQSRLFMATFGRLIFGGGLYRKLKYVNRLDLLWDNVRRKELDIPEFVYDQDEEMDCRPMMDFGLESDHPRVYYANASFDSAVPLYSMRCIA